jgi:succinate-semialdehyde dehydrogenase/glutarate-semialdehyde dehydrogenase
MSLKSINPFTNQLIGESEELSDEKITDLLNRSAIAFEEWKRTDFNLRSGLMRKAADLLIVNKDKYSRTITLEMGKPVKEAVSEVEKCAWVCRYYSENAGEFLKTDIIDSGTYRSYVSYEPLGTILGIMPWNFPFWQVFRFAVPTIMAGNTSVLKHASNVQVCARLIEDLFRQAGFPGSVFANLAVSSSRVENIIANNVIKAVSLTGSEYAGQKVAEASGRNIKKSLLELGGSNAFIVLDDADIEKAVETGIKARMLNAGQSCIAAKRFIVHEKVSEEFISRFIEKAEKLIQGDPLDVQTEIGPLSSVSQAETIEKQVSESLSMGARLATGGIRDNAFYKPTVLLGVKPGMPVFDEEVFGPVAPIIVARDIHEAVSLANKTKFGLGVTVFTNDLAKAQELAPGFRDGAVFINELVKSDPRLPFGGTGRSGYGRELSFHGIREFVNVKTVYLNRLT